MLKTTYRLACAICFGALLLGAVDARAGEALTKALEVCKGEIKSYCSHITRGDGRLIACLYANEGQISATCDYALFDAAADLQNIMSTMREVAQVCKPDIELLCGKVEAGQGRVMQCLEKKQMALSTQCHLAFEKAGVDIK